LLVGGSLLDGSSWFVGAYNKVWKNKLLYQSNSGGGPKRWLRMKSKVRKDVPPCRRSRQLERHCLHSKPSGHSLTQKFVTTQFSGVEMEEAKQKAVAGKY
jgi:hypothetical protein